MYMGERMAYYKKRNSATKEPLKYVSIISDGMAQGHCKLPWMANLKDIDFDKQLEQHLQGVYAHGRSIGIFRTFHNVKRTTNAQLHSLLLHLESLTRKQMDLLQLFPCQIQCIIRLTVALKTLIKSSML